MALIDPDGGGRMVGKPFTKSRIELDVPKRPQVTEHPPDAHEFFGSLIDMYEKYMDDIEKYKGNVETSDISHYTFEAVLEALYGKNVWKWVNKKR